MIELACPSCRNLLEVDEGFRGGVCRCFNCGTLLTVPEEEQRTEAEVLSPTASPAAADVRPRTYTTRSGKTVSLSPQQVARAPVARRPRKSIRVAVRVAAVVLALLLAGGVGLLAYVLFAPRAEKARVDPYAGLFDIEHNPYTWDEPNFMGLPVGQTTVLLIESSAAMRNHLDLVKQAVLRAAPTLGARRSVQIVFASEDQPWTYPSRMTAGSDIDVAALQVALEEVSAGGGGLAESSISGALAVKPDQVTLVARTLPDDAAAQRLADRYKSARARLVVVHIDAVEGDPESQAWAQAARATTGRYAALSSARLRRWYEEYLSTRPAPRQ